MTYPPMPSCCTIFGMPSVRPFAKPGTVCTLTFVASKAHSLRRQNILYALSRSADPTACEASSYSTIWHAAHEVNPPDVSKELCRGRACQEDERLVFGCSLGAGHDCVLAAARQHARFFQVIKGHRTVSAVTADATNTHRAMRSSPATYCLKYSYRPANTSLLSAEGLQSQYSRECDTHCS